MMVALVHPFLGNLGVILVENVLVLSAIHHGREVVQEGRGRSCEREVFREGVLREETRRVSGERPYILCTSLLIRNYLCTTYRKSLPMFRPISVNYIPIEYQPIPYRNTNSRCNPREKVCSFVCFSSLLIAKKEIFFSHIGLVFLI